MRDDQLDGMFSFFALVILTCGVNLVAGTGWALIALGAIVLTIIWAPR